jgi:hypothetical protein
MKRKDAIALLIRHAAGNVSGNGTGLRPELSPREGERVAEAILSVWRLVHSWGPYPSDFHNLGLPVPASIQDEGGPALEG